VHGYSSIKQGDTGARINATKVQSTTVCPFAGGSVVLGLTVPRRIAIRSGEDVNRDVLGRSLQSWAKRGKNGELPEIAQYATRQTCSLSMGNMHQSKPHSSLGIFLFYYQHLCVIMPLYADIDSVVGPVNSDEGRSMGPGRNLTQPFVLEERNRRGRIVK